MKIGELAKRTGLAASTIRFYEDIGLLTEVSRNSNGYRAYPAHAEWRLKLIVQGQHAGFSLDEMRRLLPADLADWQHGTLLTALQQKIDDITLLEEKLAENKRQLQILLAEIKAKPEGLDCAANAQRVLTELGLPDSSVAASSRPTKRSR